MTNRVVYHGTKGDNILGIIDSGSLKPGASHEIFVSLTDWQSVLMHGADTRRKASFAVKVEITIDDEVKSHFESKPGNPLTLRLETNTPIPAKVLELFVRKPGNDGFTVEHIVGAIPIRDYLSG